MTREEVIKFAEHAVNMTDIPEVKLFYGMAAAALTPPTQEQLERVLRAEWVVSGQCDHKPSRMRNPDKWMKFSCSKCGYSAGRKSNLNFCPNCGRAMTSEAWEELRKRWEALYENIHNT